MSVKQLSVRYRVDRRVIRRWLKMQGIQPRSRREAELIKNRLKSPKARRAQTLAANQARRGKRASKAELRQRANGIERTGHMTPYEQTVYQALQEHGIDGIPQQAVGIYNCDIGIDGQVAVEIWGGNWHFTGRHMARFPQRVREFFNRGWHLYVLHISASCPLTAARIDELIAFINFARRHPTMRREYRMVRRDGHILASGHAQSDNLAFVFPCNRGRDPVTGRYQGFAS